MGGGEKHVKATYFVVAALFGVLAAALYATPVSVTTTTLQGLQGNLLYSYFENAPPASCTTPTVNTQLSSPAPSGSSTLTPNTQVCLWSPTYTSTSPLMLSRCVLVVYVSNVPGGGATLSFTLSIVSPSGSTSAGSGSIALAGGPTTQQYVQPFSCSGTVAQGAQLQLALTSSKRATLHYGGATPTDFQVVEVET